MAISNDILVARLQDLASRLKRARLDANLTQQRLADLSGVSIKTIGNAEVNGQISLDTFLRLLDGLGRTPELASLLADPGPSPIALARQQGKQRQRVRARAPADLENTDEWQW